MGAGIIGGLGFGSAVIAVIILMCIGEDEDTILDYMARDDYNDIRTKYKPFLPRWEELSITDQGRLRQIFLDARLALNKAVRKEITYP